MANIQAGYGHSDSVGIPFDFYSGAIQVAAGSVFNMQTNQLILIPAASVAVTINLPLNPVDGAIAEITNAGAVGSVLTLTALAANTGDVISSLGLGTPATITPAASTTGGSAVPTLRYRYTLNGVTVNTLTGQVLNARTWIRVQ
jgi:hypothetical protein